MLSRLYGGELKRLKRSEGSRLMIRKERWGKKGRRERIVTMLKVERGRRMIDHGSG
jgi:hypothetical protein